MKICIVTSEIVGPHRNGGIGTNCFYLAKFLSKLRSHHVTVLYTSPLEADVVEKWRIIFRDSIGISFAHIDGCQVPPDYPISQDFFIGGGQKVYCWLRNRKFDVVILQENGGFGAVSLQSKKAGVAFFETLFITYTHGSSEWVDAAMQSLPGSGLWRFNLDALERQTVELADRLISPSQYLVDWKSRNGFRVSAGRTRIIPYLVDVPFRVEKPLPRRNHLIFFGRLESRKGLILFLQALNLMDKRLPNPPKITFLGKPGRPPADPLSLIQKWFHSFGSKWELECKTDLDHHQALSFLRDNQSATVVIPSLADNSPFAALECIEMGLNLICAKTGGIPEMFESKECLFDPHPGALCEVAIRALSGELPPPKFAYSNAKSVREWDRFLEAVKAESGHKPRGLDTPQSLHLIRVGRNMDHFDEVSQSAADAKELRVIVENIEADFVVLVHGDWRVSVGLSELLSRTPVTSDSLFTCYGEYSDGELVCPAGHGIELLLFGAPVCGPILLVSRTSLIRALDDSEAIELSLGLDVLAARLICYSGQSVNVIPEYHCVNEIRHSPSEVEKYRYWDAARDEILKSFPEWRRLVMAGVGLHKTSQEFEWSEISKLPTSNSVTSTNRIAQQAKLSLVKRIENALYISAKRRKWMVPVVCGLQRIKQFIKQ